ncbi:MAG: peptidylprolyl isomerase [Deltaproteobacteria bacterium]|nr:peptidylprolyl isomerase [Deltaproteobacteria bacterium]
MTDKPELPAAQNPVPPPDPFDMGGRRDFGIIAVVIVLVVLIGAAVFIFTRSGSTPSVGKAPVLGPEDVASVGQKVIQKTDVDRFVDEVYPALTAGAMATPPEMLRLQLAQDPQFCRDFLGQMLIRDAIAQYAKAQGVYETEEFRNRFQSQIEMVAVTEMLRTVTEVSPSEAETRKFYDEDKFWFSSATEKAKYDEVKHLIPTAMGRQKVLDLLASLRKQASVSAPDWDASVIATIDFGDEKMDITVEKFEEEASKYPEKRQVEIRTMEGRQKLLDGIVERYAAIREARRRGLMDDPKVTSIAENVRPNVAAERLAVELLGSGFDQRINEKYEQVKGLPEYRNAIYHLAHILVRLRDPMTDEEKQKARDRMQAIKDRLAQGDSFEKLAKIMSDDATSGAKGGDLGQFPHSVITPDVGRAVSGLNKGQLSEIVETGAGLHIFKALEDPAYSDNPVSVKATIRKEIMKEGFQLVEQKARESFPVFVNDAAAMAACGVDTMRQQPPGSEGMSLEDLAREQMKQSPSSP